MGHKLGPAEEAIEELGDVGRAILGGVLLAFWGLQITRQMSSIFHLRLVLRMAGLANSFGSVKDPVVPQGRHGGEGLLAKAALQRRHHNPVLLHFFVAPLASQHVDLESTGRANSIATIRTVEKQRVFVGNIQRLLLHERLLNLRLRTGGYVHPGFYTIFLLHRQQSGRFQIHSNPFASTCHAAWCFAGEKKEESEKVGKSPVILSDG